jgi:hypothetical protein
MALLCASNAISAPCLRLMIGERRHSRGARCPGTRRQAARLNDHKDNPVADMPACHNCPAALIIRRWSCRDAMLFPGKSLTGERQACIFLHLLRLKGIDPMLRFYTGRFFYFDYFFSKGLPGAR